MKRFRGTFAAALLLGLLPAWWCAYSVFAVKRDLLLLALAAAAVAAGRAIGRRMRAAGSRGAASSQAGGRLPAALWVAGGLCLLFSLATIAHLPRYYFLNWSFSLRSLRALATSGIAAFLLLTGLFAICLERWDPRRWRSRLLLAALLAGQAACALALLRVTGGAAVYSDDHPSFLFRIAEFWRAFPWFENYVPHWNAGVVNSVLVSSGTPGYAWMAAPLWWLLPPHQAHTAALILVQIVLAPWIVVLALRSLGLGRDGALAGGILALSAGRQFFVWMLHFGTVGAALSWAMAPAAFAFLHAAAVQGRVTRGTLIGLVASLFFMAQWTPTLLLTPVWAVLVLCAYRRWTPRRRLLPLAGAALLLALLLAHHLAAVLGGRELLSYTLDPAPARTPGVAALWSAFQRAVGLGVVELHPLVSAFGLAGAWALPGKRLRRWATASLLGLTLLFTLGPLLAPRLQLERLAIVAGSLAVVPAACNLRRLGQCRGPAATGLQAAALALLLLGLANTAGLYASRGFAPFTAMRPSLRQLAGWIRQHVPEDGRLLFAGPAVHAYGRGHVAYLPLLTGREMMACDYYGFPPGMVEMDYPPRRERERPGGLHGFMTLHGVSHVITYHRRYIEFLRSQPELFREADWIDSEEREGFALFEVLGGDGRFLEGAGSVRADFNRWEIRFPAPPPEQAVIAYNWHPRLRADPPATLFPHDTGRGATFIGIRPNGAREVRIRYRNRF